MSKTIQEQIEVMQHFANGDKIETKAFHNIDWVGLDFPKWDWSIQDYRIKEQRKTITIEKWLCMFDDGEYRILHSSDISSTYGTRVKLLETYEVEL